MSSSKGPDGLCIDCGCVHDYWHAEEPSEWSYKEGCWCSLCQEHERKQAMTHISNRWFEDNIQYGYTTIEGVSYKVKWNPLIDAWEVPPTEAGVKPGQ